MKHVLHGFEEVWAIGEVGDQQFIVPEMRHKLMEVLVFKVDGDQEADVEVSRVSQRVVDHDFAAMPPHDLQRRLRRLIELDRLEMGPGLLGMGSQLTPAPHSHAPFPSSLRPLPKIPPTPSLP